MTPEQRAAVRRARRTRRYPAHNDLDVHANHWAEVVEHWRPIHRREAMLARYASKGD